MDLIALRHRLKQRLGRRGSDRFWVEFRRNRKWTSHKVFRFAGLLPRKA